VFAEKEVLKNVFGLKKEVVMVCTCDVLLNFVAHFFRGSFILLLLFTPF
jgi:hypothetical protein